MDIPAQISKDELEAFIRGHEDLDDWRGDKEVVKIIAIPGKLVNIVVK